MKIKHWVYFYFEHEYFEAAIEFSRSEFTCPYNISQICYCGKISLQSAAVNCGFSDNLIPLGVTFTLHKFVSFNTIHVHSDIKKKMIESTKNSKIKQSN